MAFLCAVPGGFLGARAVSCRRACGYTIVNGGILYKFLLARFGALVDNITIRSETHMPGRGWNTY